MKFKYSNTNKRYHTIDYAFKKQYNSKIAKLCVDTNYTCINRDGIKGYNGCSFCPGANISGQIETKKLIEQLEDQKRIIQRKWPKAKYQLYFQSFSNTYAPLTTNKNNYELYQNIEDVVAISIATRVDSLSDSTLNYLNSLTDKIDVSIELGLQSIFDETRNALNCQYTLEDFEKCVLRIAKTKCSIIVHLINGLPNETAKMMIASAKYLNSLPISGIKIHMLYLDRTTAIANDYLKKPFPLLTLDEYSDIVIEQLRNLRPEIVIHRLTGDPIRKNLIAPEWVLNKTNVLNTIDKKMAERNCYQGDYA